MAKRYTTFISSLIITASLITTTILLGACKKHSHDSIVSCDITSEDEYIIKWDIFPKADGDVKIYISDSPTSFNTDAEPIVVAQASEGAAYLPTPNPLKRHYFLLNFNDCFTRIVGARASFVQSAYAFRDLGGYSGAGNRKTHWGMIYRTGTLDTLSNDDKIRIKNINPKTIIEDRPKEECKYSAEELGVENVIYMSCSDLEVDSIIDKIYKGEFTVNEARTLINDYYFSLIEEGNENCFTQMFDILSDKSNYPIIISSRYGKGFNDMASLFILTALGVSNDDIYEDYTWANQYFCKSRLIQKISHLPSEVHEAIASIIHNNRKDLMKVVTTMQSNHKSIDSYLINTLDLNIDKRKRIQNILLVNEAEL